MNKEHLPEPWIHRKAASGQWEVSTSDTFGNQRVTFCADEATARRIVACVNACDGLSTRGLENRAVPEMVAVISKTAFFLQNLIQQMENDGGHKPTIALLKHNLAEINALLTDAFRQ